MRLLRDFPAYAEEFLRIRSKSGAILPLVLNPPQRFIHARLEAQLAETKRVRALILKGRQQGCSTYVGGRFYKLTSNRKGVRTFILTHENDATANLFGMVERYHEYMHPEWKPSTGASNRKELVFDRLDSGYRVGTAGSQGVGRSATIQLFHGSEVAFWPHAEEHAAGILQAIPNVPGTEAIFESTANGIGNWFHKQWLKAVAGRSDYQAIFSPWFWSPEYAVPVPDGFDLDADEAEYQNAHGLTLEQMAWRRAKIIDLGDPKLFKQEYPATPDEAFQTTGIDSYIPASIVMTARRQEPGRQIGPVVAAYDPKRDGQDRGAFIYRRGRLAWGLEYNDWSDFPKVLGYLQERLRADVPYISRLFIDYGGSGWELGQMLASNGFGDRVTVVNFGSKAKADHIYANRRAEMWGALKGWLLDPVYTPTIPDEDALGQDIAAPSYGYDSRTRYILESKEKMHARLGFSPDGGDALALTFAEPVLEETKPTVVTANNAYDVLPGVSATPMTTNSGYKVL